MKIIVVIGTRAEYLKMVPIFRELTNRKIPFKFIATGQHNLKCHIKEFGFTPEQYITEPPKLSSKFMGSKIKIGMWLCVVLFKLWKIFIKEEKSIVTVHGDTASGFISALAAKLAKQKIAHVEGMLRSNCDIEPYPEEKFRKKIDKYSDLLFVPTKQDMKNIKKLGNKKAWVTGNTSIDLIKGYNIKPKEGKFVLAIIHRTENLFSEWRLRMIVTVLNHLDLPIILFAHDNFLYALNKFNLSLDRHIKIKKLTTHKEFIKKLAACKFAIVDGGGCQEEAAFLGKPCIVMRAHTERHGFNFGDGNTAKRIVNILQKELK